METITHTAQSTALRRTLCYSCFRTWVRQPILAQPSRLGLQNSDRIQRRHKSNIAKPGEQAQPLQGFYAELVSKPMHEIAPATRTAPEPPPPEDLPMTDKEETLQKARVVFGSRLAGPAERKAEILGRSKVIAGITVPPRPTEPDNCCMSGCVNCVWDLYRDEIEEWAAKSAEARAAIQAQKQSGQGSGTMIAEKSTPTHVAVSMDDDGGGSETNWTADAVPANLFDDIPIGIREFMKTEKMLKQRHVAEGSVGG